LIRRTSALTSHGLLLLALSWPDESKIHEDELGTIFPTKTPEYLASGNLIVVHCPSTYFLARFLQENDCGIVIDTKSPEEMQQKLQAALSDVENVDRLRRNALKAAEMFQIEKVASVFSNTIEEALNKESKQPVPSAAL
jgi:glycosyltransferase involved in cell wall biosynthesis